MEDKSLGKELKDLLQAPSGGVSKSWADFTNNFLFSFFEGQSFTVWLFVSGLLIVLYGKFAVFEKDYLGEILKYVSLILLFLLVSWSFVKNVVYAHPLWIFDKITILPLPYRLRQWVAETEGSRAKKLNLPVKTEKFKKICFLLNVADVGSGRWRAGVIFNKSDGKGEYIFHTYQDKGSTTFRYRIVEIQPGKEVVPDRNGEFGVKNPHFFEFCIENKKNIFSLYINGGFAASYEVPVNDISNIVLAAWSDDKPIKMMFEDVKVLT